MMASSYCSFAYAVLACLLHRLVIVSVAVPVVVMLPVVSISVMVRMMIVFDSTAVSHPVTCKVSLAVVVRWHPVGSLIRRSSPVTFMPFVMMTHRIPIAFYPYKFRSRLRRHGIYHDGRRRRWCPNLDTNRDLRPSY